MGTSEVAVEIRFEELRPGDHDAREARKQLESELRRLEKDEGWAPPPNQIGSSRELSLTHLISRGVVDSPLIIPTQLIGVLVLLSSSTVLVKVVEILGRWLNRDAQSSVTVKLPHGVSVELKGGSKEEREQLLHSVAEEIRHQLEDRPPPVKARRP